MNEGPTARESGLSSAIVRFTELACRQEESAKRLASRLQPVLRQEPTGDSCEKTQRPQNSAPGIEALLTLADRLKRTTEQFEELPRRLEV